ncbi:hypothetical protein SAMN04487913_10136 [Arthrobacter sp. ok362]|nr:hypothetical protein SAMN04487913_10136 [Arthrobacter sp. ok362]
MIRGRVSASVPCGRRAGPGIEVHCLAGRSSAGALPPEPEHAVGSPSGPNDLAPAVTGRRRERWHALRRAGFAAGTGLRTGALRVRGGAPSFSCPPFSRPRRRGRGRRGRWRRGRGRRGRWRRGRGRRGRWPRGRGQAGGNWGAGNPAVDDRVHGGFSWVTANGRPRQPDGPCSVEAETARLVRRRTGISANGCVLVLERTADGVGLDCWQVEEQAGHPRSRSGRPIGGVAAAGPGAGSRRECLRRRQARAAMPRARTRVAGGNRRVTSPRRGFSRRGRARPDRCPRTGFRHQPGGIGNRGDRGIVCLDGTGRIGTGGSRRRRFRRYCLSCARVGGARFCGTRGGSASRRRCAADGCRRPRRFPRRDVARNGAAWRYGRRVTGQRAGRTGNRSRGVYNRRNNAGNRSRGVHNRRNNAGIRCRWGHDRWGHDRWVHDRWVHDRWVHDRWVHDRWGNAGARDGRIHTGDAGVHHGRGHCRIGERRLDCRRNRVRRRGPRGGRRRFRNRGREVRVRLRRLVSIGGINVRDIRPRARNGTSGPGARRGRSDVHGDQGVDGGNREVVGVRAAGGRRSLAGVVGRPGDRARVIRLCGRAGEGQPCGAGDGGQEHVAQGADGAHAARGAARAGGRCCWIHVRTPAPRRLDDCLQGKSAPTGSPERSRNCRHTETLGMRRVRRPRDVVSGRRSGRSPRVARAHRRRAAWCSESPPAA